MLCSCGNTQIQYTGILTLFSAAPQVWCWREFLGEKERLPFKSLQQRLSREYQISIFTYMFYVLYISVHPDISTEAGTSKAPNTFHEINRHIKECP